MVLYYFSNLFTSLLNTSYFDLLNLVRNINNKLGTFCHNCCFHPFCCPITRLCNFRNCGIWDQSWTDLP